MRFILILLFAIILIPEDSNSQINALPGILVLRNGSTHSGVISFFYDQPGEVHLLKADETKSIFPSEVIREIRLNGGEVFASYPVHENDITTYLICRLLIESPAISLYAKDYYGVESYLAAKDSILVRIENNHIIIKREQKEYMYVDRKYTGTFTSMMIDRPEMLNRIKNLPFTLRAFEKLILDYNGNSVTYYYKNNVKYNTRGQHSLFGGYVNYASARGLKVATASYGFNAGYSFSPKKGRNVFNFPLQQMQLNLIDGSVSAISASFTYRFDFIMKQNYSLYFDLQVLELLYVTARDGSITDFNTDFQLRIPINPGVGCEVRPWQHLAVYAGFTQLFQLEAFPANFNLGLRYRF